MSKVVQGALAFLLELAALGALGYWGFSATPGASAIWRWVLGLGAPGAMILIWSLFLAADGTKARVGLPYAVVIALKVAVFGAAAAALCAAGAPSFALVLSGFVALSVVADAVRPLQR